MTAAASTTLIQERRLTGRLAYFDNLRTMLTVLVVVHHAAIAYSDIPMWYYLEPAHDRSAMALDILLVFNQMFFMGFFFLISGYFVPTSYDRKGAGKYFRDRLIRLGVPLVIFTTVLNPILSAGYFPVVKAQAAANGIHLPFWRFYLKALNPGPMWFVEVLLVFCAVYVLARRIRSAHSVGPAAEATPIKLRTAILAIVGYTLALTALNFLWRIVVPIGQTWSIGLPTPAFLPQYVTLFAIGLLACRHRWTETLPKSAGWFGLAMLLCTLTAAPFIFAAAGRKSVTIAMTAVEAPIAVGIIVAMFVLFRERFNHQGPLGRIMSDQAYTVYIIHPLVLVILNLAFERLHAISLVKFIIVATLAIPLCWICAYVVRSLPHAKRIL